MSYKGNKRQEVVRIFDEIDFEKITTVIEPYCGSCAMSYYISTQYTGIKYILNDNNQYLKEMYEIMMDEDKITFFENKINNEILPIIKNSRKEYEEFLKTNKEKPTNIYKWFIANKYRGIRTGVFNLNPNGYKPIDLKSYPIYEFFNNNDIEFTTDNGLEVYKKYKDDEQNLILMDPPYLTAVNYFYSDPDINIYEYLYNNPIEEEEAQVLLILENIWIIKLLFQNNITEDTVEYSKKYLTSKRQTTHIIIKNK
jgi:parvulin-like peptidyl-prolyl isomerase